MSTDEDYETRMPKKRHVSLVLWLGLLIVFDVSSVLASGLALTRDTHFVDTYVGTSGLRMVFLLGLWNLVAAIGLLFWEKWGFYALCASGAFAVVWNLAQGADLARSFGGLWTLAVTFGVLHIGRENRGWPQLD